MNWKILVSGHRLLAGNALRGSYGLPFLHHSKRHRIQFANKNPNPVFCGHFYLLPYVPPETIDNNKFVAAMTSNQFPPFADVKELGKDKIIDGFIRMAIDCGTSVFEADDKLTDNSNERKFSEIFGRVIEDEHIVKYALNCIIQIVRTTDLISKNDIIQAIQSFNTNTHKKFETKYENIYNVVKAMLADKQNLNKWERRLMEMYAVEMRYLGADFAPLESPRIIEENERNFVKNENSRRQFIFNIAVTKEDKVESIQPEDKHFLADAPFHVLLQFNRDNPLEGPWTSYLHPRTYFMFMKYCAARELRYDHWFNWSSRAGFQFLHQNNSSVIENIRITREKTAKELGYECHADIMVENKMAGSKETVRTFINALKKRLKRAFFERYEDIGAFAQKRDMLNDIIYAWDMYYYCRKEAEHKHGIDPLDVEKYFPFWPTFNNIVHLFSNWFGLKFENVTACSSFSRLHSDVVIYDVTDRDSGKKLGVLYFDPFLRQDKVIYANSSIARVGNRNLNQDRIVFLNFSARPAGQPHVQSVLHIDELKELLKQFGRSIQYFLSDSPFMDLIVPKQTLIAADSDAANMFPCFAECFVYKSRLVKQLCSPHVESGKELTESDCANLVASLQRATLWDGYRCLFWSDFDATLASIKSFNDRFWLSLYGDLWNDYHPFLCEKLDNTPCSFTPCFVDTMGGIYYSKLWSEMLALDVHCAFEEEDNPEKTGLRLKETVLYAGAGEKQSEIFRRFRGRDPSTDPICDFYDQSNS